MKFDKETLKGILQPIGCFIWFILGIVQFFAIYWLVDNYIPVFLINFVIALILAYIPIVGSIIAIYAACTIWHWNIWLCILLFCPTYIMMLGAFIYDFIENRLKK